jgi:tRNA-splicing ligase RtcB
MKHKINGPKGLLGSDDLENIGIKSAPQIGIALELLEQIEFRTKKQALNKLKVIATSPINYVRDKQWGDLAKAILESEKQRTENATIPLASAKDFNVFGQQHIEPGAMEQMYTAMKLPVTKAGALMPDAHQGYGLPIGGVLATKNAIIPYAVGVDIGCRMALSVYDIPGSYLLEDKLSLKRELIAHTNFGSGGNFEQGKRTDHKVLANELFETNALVKSLKDKAYVQLGTSGGGNHFAEFGIIEFEEADEALNVPKGKFLALLTHSGSRGLGATLANHYTKIAKEKCKLPGDAKHLAYLDMNSEEGQEYWYAMNLAGDYASACHETIHRKMKQALGAQVLATVENHHNFAWKETFNGEELIVHRKGATPAGKEVMGIIPGSMTAPGFLVRGKGNEASLNSASHGAGRKMSRSKAKASFTRTDLKAKAKEHEILLIGSGVDEIPMAYKDINEVMKSQKHLVDVVAQFTPKVVRMADDSGRSRREIKKRP